MYAIKMIYIWGDLFLPICLHHFSIYSFYFHLFNIRSSHPFGSVLLYYVLKLKNL